MPVKFHSEIRCGINVCCNKPTLEAKSKLWVLLHDYGEIPYKLASTSAFRKLIPSQMLYPLKPCNSL